MNHRDIPSKAEYGTIIGEFPSVVCSTKLEEINDTNPRGKPPFIRNGVIVATGLQHSSNSQREQTKQTFHLKKKITKYTRTPKDGGRTALASDRSPNQRTRTPFRCLVWFNINIFSSAFASC